jgi:ribonuclease HI
MTNPIRLWTSAAYHPAFRCGGWAFVREAGGQLSGGAGGERYTSAGRMALAGLAAGLRDLPAGAAPLAVSTSSPELAAFAGVLARLGQAGAANSPDEDIDLWAQILAAARGRAVGLIRAAAEPGTPGAFTAAWAELARDKAKATGPFAAAIPKANLAKVAGLEA